MSSTLQTPPRARGITYATCRTRGTPTAVFSCAIDPPGLRSCPPQSPQPRRHGRREQHGLARLGRGLERSMSSANPCPAFRPLPVRRAHRIEVSERRRMWSRARPGVATTIGAALENADLLGHGGRRRAGPRSAGAGAYCASPGHRIASSRVGTSTGPRVRRPPDPRLGAGAGSSGADGSAVRGRRLAGARRRLRKQVTPGQDVRDGRAAPASPPRNRGADRQ
jgi:hypothetical protein